jgi:hypothetical protein
VQRAVIGYIPEFDSYVNPCLTRETRVGFIRSLRPASSTRKEFFMSTAQGPSLPVSIGPLALLRVEVLPVERHPAAVYLASLGSGSRRTMRQSLGVIANLVSGGRADVRSLAWEKLRYQHCQAVRTALAEKYAAGTTNKMLAALRGVLKEA